MDALQSLLAQADFFPSAEANAAIVAISNLVLFSRAPSDLLTVHAARGTLSAVDAAIKELQRSRFTFGRSVTVPWEGK